MKDFLRALKEIRAEMQFLMEHVRMKEDLIEDPVLARASDRSLQIIGEAAKKIPDDIKEKYPDVPWKGMTGMRDIIVHEYDEIDVEQVWNTIANDIPATIEKISTVIQGEED